MLTRTEKPHESEIFIGDDVVVRVVLIHGDKVRLAIEAPTRIAVHRGEVKRRIDAERARLAPVIVTPPGVRVGGGA